MRPPRGGRPFWRGRGDYHYRGSYHNRYSSSSRPSYHTSHYDDRDRRSRDRDRERPRRDSRSRREHRSYSKERRRRSRSRSPRYRRSRDSREKYSRSRSRSYSSSSSRSSSRHRSRSRSRTQSHSPQPSSSHSLNKGIAGPSPSEINKGLSQAQGVDSQNNPDLHNQAYPKPEQDSSQSQSEETAQDKRNKAENEATDMTTGVPVTIPPPSRWERDGTPEDSATEGYHEAVELYAGLAVPALASNQSRQQSDLSMPLNLQKKSLVITFSNDQFKNAPATSVLQTTTASTDKQPTFETAVTPPRVNKLEDVTTTTASSVPASQKSLFPSGNIPMWKPLGELDMQSPLITEEQAAKDRATQKQVQDRNNGKKKSKEELQKEIRDLEVALAKKRKAKKGLSGETSEDTQSGDKERSESHEEKRVRSRSKSNDSDRSDHSSSPESSQEREGRKRNQSQGRDHGKKKHDRKERPRRDRSKDGYEEPRRSKYSSKDIDRHSRHSKERRNEHENERYREERQGKHRDGQNLSDTNEPEPGLHASLLTSVQQVIQPSQIVAPVSQDTPTGDMGTSYGMGDANIAEPPPVASQMDQGHITSVSRSVSQKDALAVDNFLQSLGLPSGSSMAPTAVSYSMQSAQMSSTLDDNSNIPGIQDSHSLQNIEPVKEQPFTDSFEFPFRYREGQGLPGLDLPIDKPPPSDPKVGFQNADEEDEYLYGSNDHKQKPTTGTKHQEYVSEITKPTPPENEEKDEQLNKILSAIGFDFDMAKQIVEQTKKKEQDEQSQIKSSRKGKKQDGIIPDRDNQGKKKGKENDTLQKVESAESSEKTKSNLKEDLAPAAQQIPSIVRRVAVSPETVQKETNESVENQSTDEWSNQYYGPPKSTSFFPPTSSSMPVTSSQFGPSVPPYGPPIPTGEQQSVPPIHGPPTPAPPTHGPPTHAPPSHGPSTHGPSVPPSYGHHAMPQHPPPEQHLPVHGPPVPPHGPPEPPPFDQGYSNFPHGPYLPQGHQHWPYPYQYDSMGPDDGGYYRRSLSPSYQSPGRFSKSYSRSYSQSRSSSYSRSRSRSRSASFSSHRSPSPSKKGPKMRKRKERKPKAKSDESDIDSGEEYIKKRLKKARRDESRDSAKNRKMKDSDRVSRRSKDSDRVSSKGRDSDRVSTKGRDPDRVPSKGRDVDRIPNKEREDSKDRNAGGGIKVSLSRNEDEDKSRRIIMVPKSQRKTPEKKKGKLSHQDDMISQEKEKLKQEASLLIKEQEQLFLSRMEQKKHEMQKEWEKEKRKKEKVLSSLELEFKQREGEIKKREEIIIRVEDKLRKEQEKKMLNEMLMEEEKQIKLKKEKEDYKRRLHFLGKELDRLHRSQGDLLRKKQREKDGHKDPGVIENNEQQEEILTQIKRLKHAYSEAYGKPLPEEPEQDRDGSHERSRERSPKRSRRSQERKESRHSSERGKQRESEREPPEGKSRFNFVYFDNGDHWCMCCNKILGDINGYLIHLHSKNHMKNCDPHDRPWKSLTPTPPTKPLSSSSIQAPFKGAELFVPTNAFYCRLCKVFLGDVVCASEHIKQRSHNLKYQKFTEENPMYEKQVSIKKASLNPSKDPSPEPEGDKQKEEEPDKERETQEKRRDSKEDDRKKKFPYIGRRPGYSRGSRFDVKAQKEDEPKPDKEEEKEEEGKDEEQSQDPAENDDGKKDSKFKFKFAGGKKLKTTATTTASSTAVPSSTEAVTTKATSAVTGPKGYPVIGKRSRSKLVISKPEPEPEQEIVPESEEKYKEMKSSLDQFLQMKSGSLPVVVDKKKKEADATDALKSTTAAPALPPSTSPSLVTTNTGNKNNIAKAYQDIAAKEKAAEKKNEANIPQPPTSTTVPNPPLPPTRISDVIKNTLSAYSTAHHYQMGMTPVMTSAVAPMMTPVINTSLPPPPPPTFMLAAGVLPTPPALPAQPALMMPPRPPNVPNPLMRQPPLLANPPPPGTQPEQEHEKDGETHGILTEYGELLPDGETEEETEKGDKEDLLLPGEEGVKEDKSRSSDSDMEDDPLYWY